MFLSVLSQEIMDESSKGLKGAWVVKTKRLMVREGEETKRRKAINTIKDTRVTKFRTKTYYSQSEGACNFAPTLLICLAFAWGGLTQQPSVLLQYGNISFKYPYCTPYMIPMKPNQPTLTTCFHFDVHLPLCLALFLFNRPLHVPI